ncbi:MAG: SAM-dependent methyltransferase [Bacteroidetes bacterium]|nr:SAM-dependent methyltransferase [Bacteroidota bacterium]
MKKGTLYLIPSFLGECPAAGVFPSVNKEIVSRIRYFIVEEIRTARRFLKKISPEIDIDTLTFALYNEHSNSSDVSSFLDPLQNGEDAGIISEAGTPCVADPGSWVVRMAHETGIRVVPLVGPSSILLALMASGFNGQNFVFHGYLPIEKAPRTKKLHEIEQDLYKKDQTQIFMEAPYRNLQLLQAITETCQESTLLCLATSVTTSEEKIMTLPVRKWKKAKPDIHKKPTVFLLYR